MDIINSDMMQRALVLVVSIVIMSADKLFIVISSKSKTWMG